ncbi:hypothetical protein KUCAC02_011374 [Chaenocephalus aceratus]|uniref:Uncharacterized protein n=1 Tax=Chaenocephalus aceratus TaxID=36190 RepID=A0ACB9WWJ3_CHAAC|nr:hypothetical protein KUCAC02_011374 [Chaenocephalus aceratus]
MEEGVLEEDPVGAMVFGNPNDEQRGRGMRRNRREDEKKTPAENAGRSARRKEDKERERGEKESAQQRGSSGKKSA